MTKQSGIIGKKKLENANFSTNIKIIWMISHYVETIKDHLHHQHIKLYIIESKINYLHNWYIYPIWFVKF